MEKQALAEQTVIISCAMTGTATPKGKNGALPVTPQEIAEDAVAAWKAGAAVVHLHMRDEEQKGVMDWRRFQEETYTDFRRPGAGRAVLQPRPDGPLQERP